MQARVNCFDYADAQCSAKCRELIYERAVLAECRRRNLRAFAVRKEHLRGVGEVMRLWETGVSALSRPEATP